MKEMGGLAQSLYCVCGAQPKMEMLLGAHVESFANFCEETHQRVLALNQGILLTRFLNPTKPCIVCLKKLTN